MTIPLRPLGAALFAMLGLHACSDGALDGGACTAMFASIPVMVVDGTGEPVVDATVTAVLVRTGQVLPSTGLLIRARGSYTLVDDGSTSLLRESGDAVRADITTATQSVSVDYVISVPGGCHVNRVSGPESVTLP